MSPDPGPGRNIGLTPLKRRARKCALPVAGLPPPGPTRASCFWIEAAERERLGRRRGPPPRGSQADALQRQSGLAPWSANALARKSPP